MNYYLVVFFSYSIFIAAILGIIRLRHIDNLYVPFIICTCVAAINEVFSYLCGVWFHDNTINNNIYVLAEALLITWQFHRWGLFEKARLGYYVLLVLILGIWVSEYHNLATLKTVGLYFRLAASLIIVLMSVNLSGKLIINYRKSLWTSPTYLICCGYIVFFTFEIFIETAWIYGLDIYPSFQTNVFYIMTWINLFVNLLYAFAVVCIPTKPRFITLY